MAKVTIHRRDLLKGSSLLALGASTAQARVIRGELPWEPNAGDPPAPVQPGPYQFFTAAEAAAIEAIADRIIPPDPQTPGGRNAGCAVFIDRQLAGPYGKRDGLYVRAPIQAGAKNQGPQDGDGPGDKYRKALAALDAACRARFAGKPFSELSADDQDAALKGLEDGSFKLDGVDGALFFEQAIKDVQMGFFADPVYGGNRDMVGWKMIGYPGARYNYLDWVSRHNERFPLPPVAMTGRAEWTPKAR